MQLSVCSDDVVQQAKEDALLYETVQGGSVCCYLRQSKQLLQAVMFLAVSNLLLCAVVNSTGSSERNSKDPLSDLSSMNCASNLGSSRIASYSQATVFFLQPKHKS